LDLALLLITGVREDILAKRTVSLSRRSNRYALFLLAGKVVKHNAKFISRGYSWHLFFRPKGLSLRQFNYQIAPLNFPIPFSMRFGSFSIP
jgi:hypothetical protein